MERTIRALFVVVAIINLLPIAGVTSGGRLESMYSVAIPSPDLVVMMRHRAVLLAIVGALLLAAAVHPSLRAAAACAGFASMVSFLLLVAGESAANDALRTVAAVDLVAVILLAIAFALDRRTVPR